MRNGPAVIDNPHFVFQNMRHSALWVPAFAAKCGSMPLWVPIYGYRDFPAIQSDKTLFHPPASWVSACGARYVSPTYCPYAFCRGEFESFLWHINPHLSSLMILQLLSPLPPSSSPSLAESDRTLGELLQLFSYTCCQVPPTFLAKSSYPSSTVDPPRHRSPTS